MGSKLLICIDCGGSKTSAVLASSDTGEILARTLGGPSNFTYLGVTDFTAVISETLDRSLLEEAVLNYLGRTQVPLSLGEEIPEDSIFHSAWIAVSGVDTKSDEEAVRKSISTLLGIPIGPRLLITNDTHLLAAPLSVQSKYKSCLVAIAGTGSCIASFRLSSDGTRIEGLCRTGGYGWILGDEGGGFHVGRETVRELCLQDDIDNLHDNLEINVSSKATHTLKPLVLDQFGLPPTSRPSDIFRGLYAPDPSSEAPDNAGPTSKHLLLERSQRLSTLAPAVFKAAFPPAPTLNDLNGASIFVPDPIALKILHKCASELADSIIILCEPPSFATLSEQPRARYIQANESILYLGGSLVKQEPYRSLLASILEHKGHKFADVIYVADCEKGGIDALFKQAKLVKQQ